MTTAQEAKLLVERLRGYSAEDGSLLAQAAGLIERLTAPVEAPSCKENGPSLYTTQEAVKPAYTSPAPVENSELVERVARALYMSLEGVADHPANKAHVDWWFGAGQGEPNFNPELADDYRAAARAAIAALQPASPCEIQTQALMEIAQWADAYLLKVFPEPDLEVCRAALEAVGQTLDAVSASNMRHVIGGVGKIARAALSKGPDHAA